MTPSFKNWRWLYLDRFLFNINPVNLWRNSLNPSTTWVETIARTRADLFPSYLALFESIISYNAVAIGRVLAFGIPFGILLWSLPLWP